MPPLSPSDIKCIRERLAAERGPRFWRSLEELADSGELRALLADEFPRLEPLWAASISRRNVLKLMAASMALAGLTACDRQPAELIVPYVNRPEGMVPGEPKYYATTQPVAGYAHGLLAETHEGRPTKVEGNPDHPATLGACDVFSQASVLSLYDPDRSSAVRYRGQVASYSRLLLELSDRQAAWDANGGRGLCLLTETLTSPSQYARLQGLLQRWPEARWYSYEPVDRSAVFTGTELLFGEPLEPIYHFSRPRVIVSLDADFLASMPGFLRYAHDFISQRRPRDGITLSRLYVAEATPSITGAAADHRLRVTYQQIDALARQLARKLGLDVAAPVQPVDEHWVSVVADDLKANLGNALVVPGDQQPPAVHAIAQAINHHIGAYGGGVAAIEPVDYSHQAQPLEALAAAMHADAVEALVVLGGNPVYTAPADFDFG
ncbi:MAG: TAT-variant-translocated molybdopterin oxidoreductase, partial [Nitrococcus sp.]|nr:TAT-variant-translocated molybdopterin oxidoreductase [Nitrococcus sp.]